MDTGKKKAGVAVLCLGATAAAVVLSGSLFLNQGSEKAEASEISAARAKQIALAETGGGTIVKYSLDYENGKKMYDIKIVNGNTEYEMDISATDSKIYSFEKKTIKAATTNAALKVTPAKEITIEKAKQIALAKSGGGTVTSAKVDYENGKKVFDIKITNGNVKHEMDVNATDSKIYSYEKETIRTVTNNNNATTNNKAQTTTPKTTTPPKTSATTPKATEISAARAQQIALGKTGGGRVTKSYVDYENGRKVYDITIVNGNYEYDLEIGATNSVVYSFDKEVIQGATTPTAPVKPTKPTTSGNATNNNGTYHSDDDDRYDDDDKYDTDRDDDDDRYDND
nr:PepSY domain-containing protein [Listeria portnoyi]